MKYLSSLFVLMMAFAGPVRADYLNWTYTSTTSVNSVTVNTPSDGGATVTVTGFGTPQAGGTSIPIHAYITVSHATTPISFNNATYNLAMTLTDSATNDSRTLNFTGSLTGSLTATTSTVLDSFTPVASDSVTFDGHTYTVNIPSVTLAPPTSPQVDIMASVSVTSGGSPTPPPPPHGTPEPTTLLLSSSGISGLCLAYWRSYRRRV